MQETQEKPKLISDKEVEDEANKIWSRLFAKNRTTNVGLSSSFHPTYDGRG